MAISHRFVQLLGGDIRVTSTVGAGTTFTVDIQAEQMAESAVVQPFSARRAIALAPGQPQYRFLIVDDKPDNRKLLVTLLAPFGFELREAVNAQEAIDIWATWKPHLIWMDLRMPVLDGYEATQYIKARPQGQQTRVIVLSASVVDDDRLAVLVAGGDAFLRKPFQAADIFKLLEQHLGIQFLYVEDVPSQAETAALDTLIAALADVPQDLRNELALMARQCDLLQMLSVIDTISATQPDLAEHLKRLAQNFEYETILNALDRF